MNLRRLFGQQRSATQRKRSNTVPQMVELLEDRSLLTVTLDSIGVFGDGIGALPDLGDGKTMFVPLTAVETDGADISYQVTSSDPGVTATVLPPTRSLRINFSGTDLNGNAFQGDMTLRLFEDEAPLTTQAIIDLVESGFYDQGTDGNSQIAHRIIDGFIIQFGDPTGTGSGDGSVDEFDDEYDRDLTFSSSGLLAMAKSNDDTNTSQMFITDLDLPLAAQPERLNFNHTILGVLTSGFDTFRDIISTPTTAGDRPINDVTLNSIEVIEDNQNGVVRLESVGGFTGSSTINVTASNAAGDVDNTSFSVNVVTDTIDDNPFLGDIDAVRTPVDTPITITLDGIDIDDDQLNFQLIEPNSSNVSIGTVDVDQSITDGARATVVVTPNAGFEGSVSLQATVDDGTGLAEGNVDRQTFILTIGSNLQPNADAQTLSVASDTPLPITLTGDDGESPGVNQDLTFAITNQPTNGTIIGFNAATGVLTYEPDVGFEGTDSFEFTVTDSGGTADGGVDTSDPATITINVEDVQSVSLPNLVAADDTGRSDTDNFTSADSWTFEITGAPDAIVDIDINGTLVNALESPDTPGLYTATVETEDIVPGVNEITATQQADGTTTVSDVLEVFFVEEQAGFYTVPGDGTAEVSLTFGWEDSLSEFSQEFGFFIVDDDEGTITVTDNGETRTLTPGSSDYISTALNLAELPQDAGALPVATNSSRLTVFNFGQGPGATNDVIVREGDRLVFYIVSNTSRGRFLHLNPGNVEKYRGTVNTYISLPNGNPDNLQHMEQSFNSSNDTLLMHWEDMWGTGDSDFNDVVISLLPPIPGNVEAGESFVIPAGDNSTIDVETSLEQFDGRGQEFADGEFGVFPVTDGEGLVNGILPGAPTYVSEVATVAQTLFGNGDDIADPDNIAINGGLVGFYHVPNGSLADIAANNPTNDPDIGNVALFSFDAANPGGVQHFRTFNRESSNQPITPLTADELNIDLYIMDEVFGDSDNFNDYILRLRA